MLEWAVTEWVTSERVILVKAVLGWAMLGWAVLGWVTSEMALLGQMTGMAQARVPYYKIADIRMGNTVMGHS